MNNNKQDVSNSLWSRVLSDELDKSQNDNSISSFFIDLDCQFLMVPKHIIFMIIIKRLIFVLTKL